MKDNNNGITTPTPAASATKKRANAVVTMEQADNVLVFNVLGAGSLKLDMTKIHADILQRAAIHGLKQRISDAAALSCDPDTGKPATAQEKFESMQELVEYYNSGATDWSRKSSGGGVARVGKVLTAMSRAYGWGDEEKAKAYVEATATKRGITYEKALAIWRGADKIVAELAKMAAESPSKVDADTLLGELEELE